MQVQSMQQAIKWVRRCPNPTGAEAEIEIRPILDMEHFGAGLTPELRESETALRNRLAAAAAS